MSLGAMPVLDGVDDPDRLRWWVESRFAMSIHYGLYCHYGSGEWVRAVRKMSAEQYREAFDAFRPAADACRQWARAARLAGAKTLLLTTKHHEGFCLWDSSLTDYKSTNTPARRDLVREFVDACRAEGLRVGLYYSLVDWHHPDYPAAGDRQHPLRHDPASVERDKRCVWDRYVRYLHGQVEELLSRYGTIDLLVFDFPYWEFEGEKWGATELMRMVRRLQPGIVTNDRLGVEALRRRDRPEWAGDIDHSEMNVPRRPVTDERGRRVGFEAWFPLTNSWSTCTEDTAYKRPADVVRALVSCVSKGGNLCLNPATLVDGTFDDTTWSVLERIGAWMGRNGESIYGCGDAGLEKPEWGRFTRKSSASGDVVYAHVLEQPIGHVTLPELRGCVKNGVCLATGEPVFMTDYWNPGIQHFDGPSDIFFNFRKGVAGTYALPDEIDTVVRFEVTDAAEREALLRQYKEEFARATERRAIP